MRTAHKDCSNFWHTGRKQLIMAGVVTDVCVGFPALSVIEEGFEVFVAKKLLEYLVQM